MSRAFEQQPLFAYLIETAAGRASAMLADPQDAARLRTPSDCGLTEIEQLEQSALAEDQFLAAALRLSAGPATAAAIVNTLHTHFAAPSGRIAIEAQRRAAFGGCASRGLPVGRAYETAAEIESRLGLHGDGAVGTLRAYADLYGDLWCDPRICAPATARREMLALVSILHALADEAEGTGRGEERS